MPSSTALTGGHARLACHRTPAPPWRSVRPPRHRAAPQASINNGSNGSRPPQDRKQPNQQQGWQQQAEQGQQQRQEKQGLLWRADSKRRSRGSFSKPQHEQGVMQQSWERAKYIYYNWRQSTGQDLAVLLALNFGVLVAGGVIKRLITVSAGLADEQDLFTDIYEVIWMAFGEAPQSPPPTFAAELFNLSVAAFGLAVFAIEVALLTQLVLDVLESNESRGGKVFEDGHVLALGWCNSYQDLEVLKTLLSQTCLARRNDSTSKVIVVLTCRDKLEMERCFARWIPEEQRRGTHFVFRQGNPLIPADLEGVAASRASSTVIISDQSRSAEEADAKVVRCAVLLEEMWQADKAGRNPNHHVVAEVRKTSTIPTLRFAAADPRRLMPLPTSMFNLRRLTKMVTRPSLALFPFRVLSFGAPSSIFTHNYPQLAGKSIEEVQWRFPDGIIWAIRSNGKEVTVNPPPRTTILQPTDELIMLRPTGVDSAAYLPLAEPMRYFYSDGSFPDNEVAECSQDAGLVTLGSSEADLDVFMASSEFTPDVEGDVARLMVLGWSEQSLMKDFLAQLDEGSAHLPQGSEVVFVNNHTVDDTLGQLLRRKRLKNVLASHIEKDPLSRSAMGTLDLKGFTSVIVFSDWKWIDPDMDPSNGIEVINEEGMLQLDANTLTVQLHVRQRLSEQGLPLINIVVQKAASEGLTRWEDQGRLPSGSSFNFAQSAANLLAKVAYDARFVGAFAQLGYPNDVLLVDASEFAAVGEQLSFYMAARRAQLKGDVLLGWYGLPQQVDAPMECVISPTSPTQKSRCRIWNAGDNRLKFFVIRNQQLHAERQLDAAEAAGAVAATAAAATIAAGNAAAGAAALVAGAGAVVGAAARAEAASTRGQSWDELDVVAKAALVDLPTSNTSLEAAAAAAARGSGLTNMMADSLDEEGLPPEAAIEEPGFAGIAERSAAAERAVEAAAAAAVVVEEGNLSAVVADTVNAAAAAVAEASLQASNAMGAALAQDSIINMEQTMNAALAPLVPLMEVMQEVSQGTEAAILTTSLESDGEEDALWFEGGRNGTRGVSSSTGSNGSNGSNGSSRSGSRVDGSSWVDESMGNVWMGPD